MLPSPGTGSDITQRVIITDIPLSRFHIMYMNNCLKVNMRALHEQAHYNRCRNCCLARNSRYKSQTLHRWGLIYKVMKSYQYLRWSSLGGQSLKAVLSPRHTFSHLLQRLNRLKFSLAELQLSIASYAVKITGLGMSFSGKRSILSLTVDEDSVWLRTE